MLGAVFDAQLFILGCIILGVAALEWTIHSWASHATGDPAANRKARNRMLNPIEIPLFAIVGIGLFVLSLSRVLLALGKTPSAVIFGIVPLMAFLIAIGLNARPHHSRNVVAVLVVIGGLLILGGGIAGLVHGPKAVDHNKKEAPHLYKVKGDSSALRLDLRTAGKESR